MFTFIDNYDVQETRRIAKAEGKADERKAIAKKLLEIGIPIEQVCKATGLSRKAVEQLRGEVC